MAEVAQPITKGHAIVILDSDQQPYIGPFSGFGFRYGLSHRGDLEVNEKGLDLWKDNLVLPDGYELIRVYYMINTHQWKLILASDSIPLPMHKDSPFEKAAHVVNIIPGKWKVVTGVLDTSWQEKTIHITHLKLLEKEK